MSNWHRKLIGQPSWANRIASEMPPEVLTYLNPSRYCESDLLARFSFEEFGQMPRGFSRVQAICDWVLEQLDYTSGSTNSSTTAADVLLQRTGVCRDYAHLAITLVSRRGHPGALRGGLRGRPATSGLPRFYGSLPGRSMVPFRPHEIGARERLGANRGRARCCRRLVRNTHRRCAIDRENRVGQSFRLREVA